MNFKNCRDKYNYPAAHLRCNKDISLPCNYVYVRPLETVDHRDDLIFTSTKQLDEYHNKLLNSSDPESIILGVASVQYWGAYFNKESPNHGLACFRVKRFHEGNARSKKSVNTLGKELVIDCVNNATVFIDNEKYGKALTEVMNIPWLSRSFGSKVLSFINPNRVGVYDIHISRHLEKPELEMKPTGTMTKKSESTFDRFCAFLQENANLLNSTEEPEWTDWDKTNYCWRAVDVERAMFYQATNKG